MPALKFENDGFVLEPLRSGSTIFNCDVVENVPELTLGKGFSLSSELTQETGLAGSRKMSIDEFGCASDENRGSRKRDAKQALKVNSVLDFLISSSHSNCIVEETSGKNKSSDLASFCLTPCV